MKKVVFVNLSKLTSNRQWTSRSILYCEIVALIDVWTSSVRLWPLTFWYQIWRFDIYFDVFSTVKSWHWFTFGRQLWLLEVKFDVLFLHVMLVDVLWWFFRHTLQTFILNVMKIICYDQKMKLTSYFSFLGH